MKIGVSIGDSEIVASVVKGSEVVKRISVSSEADKGKNVVIENILKAISLAIKSKKFKKNPPIGVAFPGLLNSKTRVITKTQSLPLLKVDLKKIVKQRFKTHVEIDNDVNCFVLGEFLYGAGHGYKNVLGITIGTGVGGGIIINKELYRGNGGAGEFGQMTIKFNGMIGNCGNDGSIEEYISTRGIMRLAESFGMRKVETPEDIYVSAMKNNLNATSLYREVGIYLGIEITNLINAFDPEIVVVGGDLTKAWKFFGHHMKEEIKQRALFNPKIVKGKLGKNSKIVGASCLVD